MRWDSRERKLNKRRRIKLQDRIHKERGQGKDKQSKKRMAQIIREQRKLQPVLEDEA